VNVLEDVVVASPEDAAVCELIILDHTGDSRLQWNPNDAAQTEAARKRFDELKSRRYLMYTVDPAGNQGRVIQDFDPTLGRIIAHQQMIGG